MSRGATHALTLNGRISGELWGTQTTPEEELAYRLRLLDGARRYSWILWAMPPGKDIDQVNHNQYPVKYIQTAGDGKRMTVEIRELVEREPRQYAIGRRVPEDERASLRTEIIAWDGVETKVFTNEVFDIDEVIVLFLAYYRTGKVPSDYSLRLLEIQPTNNLP